jgi:hypothetical protein
MEAILLAPAVAPGLDVDGSVPGTPIRFERLPMNPLPRGVRDRAAPIRTAMRHRGKAANDAERRPE